MPMDGYYRLIFERNSIFDFFAFFWILRRFDLV